MYAYDPTFTPKYGQYVKLLEIAQHKLIFVAISGLKIGGKFKFCQIYMHIFGVLRLLRAYSEP